MHVHMKSCKTKNTCKEEIFSKKVIMIRVTGMRGSQKNYLLSKGKKLPFTFLSPTVLTKATIIFLQRVLKISGY